MNQSFLEYKVISVSSMVTAFTAGFSAPAVVDLFRARIGASAIPG